MPNNEPNTTKRKTDGRAATESRQSLMESDSGNDNFDALMRDFATRSMAEESKIKPLGEAEAERMFKACKAKNKRANE